MPSSLIFPAAVDALARLSVQVVARDVGEEVARKVCKEFQPGVRWRRATAFIAIVMRTSHPSGRCNPEWEEISACACAVQNMHLMATALPEVCGYWSSW
jgi:nitroreductase